MINKELFLEVIQLIKAQEATDEAFSKALDLVCDCSAIVYGTKNKAYHAVMLLLEDGCNDIFHYISWWMYEDVDHTVSDETHEWHLNTAEDLYDFIVEMQDEWIQARAKEENIAFC